MSITRTCTAIALAALLALPGCSSAQEPETPDTAAATTSAAALTSSARPTVPTTSAPPAPGAVATTTATSTSASVPSPDPAQAGELIARLGQIDPGLQHDRSIGRSRNVCADLLAGTDGATVAARTEARFEGGSVPDLTPEQVQRIIDVITSTFCTVP